MIVHDEQQIDLLIGRGAHPPFEMTLGIGQAGERAARRLHQRSGWFPHLGAAREENGRGGYNLVSTTEVAWQTLLAGLDSVGSLAVVDDTLFSGFTMRTVLSHLPAATLSRTHAFCLRGVAESIPAVSALCPISLGLAAPGRILEDVSFINATGLVLRVGIRRVGLPPLAFFERPEWMRAWFPACAADATRLCRAINLLLER